VPRYGSRRGSAHASIRSIAHRRPPRAGSVSIEAEAGCAMAAVRLLLIIELRARFRELLTEDPVGRPLGTVVAVYWPFVSRS